MQEVMKSFSNFLAYGHIGLILCMLLSCHVHVPEWIYTLYLPVCQGTSCSKQAQYLKFKWQQQD